MDLISSCFLIFVVLSSAEGLKATSTSKCNSENALVAVQGAGTQMRGGRKGRGLSCLDLKSGVPIASHYRFGRIPALLVICRRTTCILAEPHLRSTTRSDSSIAAAPCHNAALSECPTAGGNCRPLQVCLLPGQHRRSGGGSSRDGSNQGGSPVVRVLAAGSGILLTNMQCVVCILCSTCTGNYLLHKACRNAPVAAATSAFVAADTLSLCLPACLTPPPPPSYPLPL